MTTRRIQWVKYGNHEGPVFWGDVPFPKATRDSPELDKWLSVLGATEGPWYNAVNGYDRCIISISVIQLCESHWLTTRLLAYGKERLAPLPGGWKALFDWQRSRGLTLDAAGGAVGARWKREDGSTERSQTRVWRGKTRADAITAARLLAGLWDTAEACALQHQFLAWQIPRYIHPDAKWLFEEAPHGLSDQQARAARAAWLSFNLNNPKLAIAGLNSFRDMFRADQSSNWTRDLCEHLVDHGFRKLWRKRYEEISSVIKELYDV